MPPRPAARRPRVRRDPEDARRLILDAAERLFADRGPDAVGLKDVAREAGVSHGLVSHYFGTYAALVDAALERRAAAARDRMFADMQDPDADPDAAAMLDRLWSWVSDPVTIRLAAWALLTGRTQDTRDFFPARVQGARLVADALEHRMRRRGKRPDRAELEFVIAAANAIVFGYALVGPAIQAALGKRADAATDRAFRAHVVEMLEGYLRR